ncbi:hypothetical protein BKA82DRAFT_4016897 [Pisolithus tinctorius]|nr:hypothetical protein BKA82DRAFT_4016897 [Pisolithus tinctorius]
MLNPKNGGHWKKLLSLTHWQEEKMIKLDTLAQVICHHLDSNGCMPLMMTKDGQTLTLAPNPLQDLTDYGEDDRVIIYSTFPLSNQALINFLDLYSIMATKLNGMMSLKDCQATLDDFCSSTCMKGHHILIISNVRMVGLNLAVPQLLQPRWHQLVGIYHMLKQVFKGKPILLMDKVYTLKGCFPGDFTSQRFSTVDRNIPNLAHVIVCPVNLKQQWESSWTPGAHGGQNYLQQASNPYVNKSSLPLKQATCVIAMMAMPITMKVQDLYIMGQWMGIPRFNNHHEFLELNKEINHANCQDSKALCKAGVEGSIIQGIFISMQNQNTPDLLSPEVTHEWMVKIHDHSNKLFGMHPYQEHILKLQMYDTEMSILRSFAKDLVKENPIASADTHKNFYIKFCHSMLHPMFNLKNGRHWKCPESLKDWHHEKTIKLDTLTQVLALYDVAVIELNRTMTLKKHQAALDDFCMLTWTTGHHVLIICNVGMVGLNLTCTNIMVIVILINNSFISEDTTWSALDDEQLCGRIFQYPQQKQVHIYHLIALATLDVFLNNISFDKGQLHSAFMECMDEINLSLPTTEGLFENNNDGEGLLLISSTHLPSNDNGGDDDEQLKKTSHPKPKPKPKSKPCPKAAINKKGKQPQQSDAMSLDGLSDMEDVQPSGSKKVGDKCSTVSSPKALDKGPKHRWSGTLTAARAMVGSLTVVTAAMQVDEDLATVPTSQVSADTTMTDPVNKILEQLQAPGGQNDPDEDKVLTLKHLWSPMLLPLTPLPSSLPEHAGESSAGLSTAASDFHGATHGHLLATNKDGSGSSKPTLKCGRSARGGRGGRGSC